MRPQLQFANLATISLLLTGGTFCLPSASLPVLAQSINNRNAEGDRLLQVAKQHFRQAEFKQAIALYQKILATPGIDIGTRAEALTRLGDIDLWINQTSQAEAKLQQVLKLTRDGKYRKGETEVLVLLAGVARNRQDYPKASELASHALMIAQQAGDLKGEAWAHGNMGTIFYSQAQYPKALEAFQTALKIAQATDDKDEMALLYSWLAITYRELKDVKQAEAVIQQQQALSREIGYRAAEHNGLWTVASLQQQQQQTEQMLQTYQKQLEIAQSADNPWFQQSALQEIGWFYVNQKQTPKALESYQKALTLAKTIDDAAIADVQNRIGVAYHWAEQYPKAMEFYQQALATYRTVKDAQTVMAQVWLNIGDVHWQLKEYSKSIEAYQRALGKYQQLKNETRVGDTENRIGNTFYRMEQYTKASEAYQRSLVAYQKTNNQTEIAKVTGNIAGAYKAQKAFSKAIEFYQQQLQIEQAIKSGSRINQAYILRTIARVYHQLKQPESAIQVYLQALEIFNTEKVQLQEKQHQYADALILWELGNRYFDQGQYEQALKVYQKSLIAYKGSTNNEADVLRDMGNTYYEMKQNSQALELYGRSLTAYQTANNSIQQAYVFRAIARTHHQLKDANSAIKFYLQALAIFRKELPKFKEKRHQYADALTLWELGNRYFDQDQYEQALKVYQESLIAYKGSVKDEAWVLLSMSNTYKQLDQLEKASKAYQQALENAQVSVQAETAVFEDSDRQRDSNQIVPHQNRLEAALNIVGEWQISQGTETSGQPHTGILTIAQLKHTYSLLWQRSTGTAAGIGILEDGRLFIGWGEGEAAEYGVVAYKINPDGSLFGRWANNSGLVGTERWTGGKPGQIEGAYQVEGSNFNGTSYQGKVSVHKTEDVYQIKWDRGIEYRGVGFRSGDYLVVGWGHSGNPGAALYEFKGNQASGTLALFQQPRLTTETISTNQTASKQNQLAEVIRLENEAGNLFAAGQAQAAIDKLQQALATARKMPNRQREAKLLQDIGVTYMQVERYPQALDFYQQALVIRQQLDDRKAETVILNGIGVVYFRQGIYAKALTSYQQSLKLAQALNQPADVALALVNIASTYTKLGKYEDALNQYQQALEIYQQAGDSAFQGRVLDKIGLNYAEQGRYEESLKAYEQALLSFKKGGISGAIEGSTLRNIGSLYASKGEYSKALSYYNSSLVAHRATFNRNRAEQGATISSQGLIASYLGQHSNALEAYKNALAIYREFGYRASEGEILSIMADAYAAQKDFPKAIELYQQALVIHDEVGNLPGKITTLSGLGAVYSVTKHPKALETHQQAFQIAQQVGSLPRTSKVLNALGLTQLQLDKDSEAQTSLQQSVVLARAVGDRPTEAYALANLGTLLTKKQQPELAIVFYKQSVNLYEGIRTGIRSLSKEQQDSYTQTIAGTYRSLADLLITQGRINEAQQVLERLKIQELNDFTKGTRSAAIIPDVSLNTIEKQLIVKHTSLINFGSKFYACEEINCPQLNDLKTQYQRLNKEFGTFVEEIKKKLRNNRLTIVNDATNDFQSSAMGVVEKNPNSILIYPLVLSDKTRILWASKGGVFSKAAVCPLGESQLYAKVAQFRTFLTQRSNETQLKVVGKDLYDCLIKPLKSELDATKGTPNEVRHLIFVPDRAINYIPISALFDGEQYVIQRYAVSTILAASKTDTRDTLQPQQASILGLGLSEARGTFSALPNVETELAMILKTKANEPGIFPGLKFLNQMFNRDALENNLKGHRILHIATHGEFKATNPRDSYFLLGTGTPYSIPDIQTLRQLQNVHLVVLSACETALGGADSLGLEMAGMSSFFMGNSTDKAKAVLASLWKVNDASTSLLMQQFYQNLATGKMTKAAALRQAQLSLMQGKVTAKNATARTDIPVGLESGTRSPSAQTDFSHPYYWAPFILIGNSL